MLNERLKRPIPASPAIVKDYIVQILNSGKPMKRDEIVTRVRRLAPENGFALDASSAIFTDKKALKLLSDEGVIESPRLAWWKLAGASDEPVNDAALDDVTEPQDNEVEAEPAIPIQREIGSGPESVYVYYHDAYAELARSRGLSVWECKIGYTLGDPDARVIGQGALTAFPRRPTIGLVIRTQNGRELERALHTALTLSRKVVQGGGGSEWFFTSPDQIAAWVQTFWKSLEIFSDQHAPDKNQQATASAT